jgi:hypothetical protein
MRHTTGSSFDWIVLGRPTNVKTKVRALIIALTLIFQSGMEIEKRVD